MENLQGVLKQNVLFMEKDIGVQPRSQCVWKMTKCFRVTWIKPIEGDISE